MTYLQRADKDGKTKAPYYYAVSEKKDETGRFETLCVFPNGMDIHFLSRGFFEPYIKITEKEFNDAKAAAQHILDSFGTEIIK